MKPIKPPPEQDDLLRARLVEMIDMRHELVKLAALIDWEIFEREWVGLFPSSVGRPATPTRLVAGLFYLSTRSDCLMKPLWPAGPRTHTGSISAARRSFSIGCRLIPRR
jgi:hypothetical protein